MTGRPSCQTAIFPSPEPNTYPSVRRGVRTRGWILVRPRVNAKGAIRLLAGTAGGQFVALDQLMLEAAHVGVLGRQLDHAVGRHGKTDALQGLLQGGLGWIGGLQSVQLAQGAL